MANKPSRFLAALILAILAYEWLVSGLNKVLTNNFVSNIQREMMESVPKIQYPFYVNLIQRYGIPHSHILGVIVEAGELLVGASFALLSLWESTNRLNTKRLKFGAAAGFVGAFMTLNFFFYQSGAFFVNTADPFDEGISIDLLMFLIQGATVTYFWSAARHSGIKTN